MDDIDLLINARWIVPMNPAGRLLSDAALAVDNGRIVSVCPQPEAASRYRARTTLTRNSHALIPGLINAHTHAPMALLRGIADDLPLKAWLGDHVWPAEARHVSAEFVRDGAELAIAEMLRAGITCFADMYFYPEAVARACVEHGMRAVVGIIVIDFPSAWADTPADYLSQGLAMRDAFSGEALISTMFAPHAPYSVSQPWLERVRDLANELDVPVHMHVHETADEVSDGVRDFGMRPLAWLEKLGLLNGQLIAVHMTALQTAEIEQLAAAGAHVVHCPESNLKLASGLCPLAKLLDAGVNVALGTDGAASNNDLDLFGEMRTAALLAKGLSGDASAVPAATVLEMATLSGARALGLDELTGSLEPGKWADITCVDLSGPHCQPLYDPLSQLVYSAGRGDVSDVWVAGRQRVADGALTGIDVNGILARAHAWGERIRNTE